MTNRASRTGGRSIRLAWVPLTLLFLGGAVAVPGAFAQATTETVLGPPSKATTPPPGARDVERGSAEVRLEEGGGDPAAAERAARISWERDAPSFGYGGPQPVLEPSRKPEETRAFFERLERFKDIQRAPLRTIKRVVERADRSAPRFCDSGRCPPEHTGYGRSARRRAREVKDRRTAVVTGSGASS